MTETQQPRVCSDTVIQISLPDDARALSTLPRIDYEDAFTVVAGDRRSPEEWVRAVLTDPPRSVRARLVLGWAALGLKLAPPWASERVLGWRMLRRDADFVLLAADSRLGFRGQLLFRSDPDGLLFATLVQQTNPAARALWAVIADRHQQVVRSLLTHAARRVSSA